MWLIKRINQTETIIFTTKRYSTSDTYFTEKDAMENVSSLKYREVHLSSDITYFTYEIRNK